MDKLQAAIAQARQQRTAGIAPGIRLPADKTQAWDALASFTPDPKHLERNRIAVNTRGPARAALDLLRTRLLELAQKNSWKRVVTRADAEPETQTFDALAALQTSRKRLSGSH